MAEYVIMPKLGFNMDKGTLVKWRKKEGDFVKEQEVLFEIETDKTVIEVEAQVSGILRKVLVAEGEEVPVTLPIAIIGDKDEDISKIIKEAYQKLGKAEMVDKEEPKVGRETSPMIEEKQGIEAKKQKEEFKKISPGARRKAKELGVELQLVEGSGPGGVVIEKDVISYYQNHQVKVSLVAQKIAERAGINLESVTGTGVGGRIIKKDVQEVLAKTAEIDKVEEKIPYTGMRKIIGDRLSQSKFTSPHIYFTTSVDMSKVIRLLKRFSQDIEKRISINDFLVFKVARVLSEQPNINCSLVGEEIVYHKDINIGVAVALEEGLIVPVVKNADKKSLSILSKETKNLVKLAREKKLMPDDYKGGTFTVSNLGMYGIENFTAIINPPEAAILAVGAVKRVPVVIEVGGVEKIEIRSLMKITLSVDHRLIDGVAASYFLNRIKYYLEFHVSLIL
ncbi:2-oxo acid dehydrogenase subunit E2 [Candidatus Atribacteria bacterium HGW-Atribacteria-1]|nr:MAG: 2-oxo acid dehydrogenase subunit E2 [Candidatus Atribacteria bacterium HGW-Atribacteria-1]